jgi:hypothetical protein
VFTDADFVYTYTRAQALADGVLADASVLAREAGFKLPVALTAAAWAECVAWTADDTEQTGVPQDEAGRLWDVLWLAGHAARLHRNSHSNRCEFSVLRVPRGQRRAQSCALVLHIGPGDAGEPVVTVMLPGED